jgi:DNA polymerase III subunit alpha
MSAKFVHLHTHSEFSIIDGILKIKPMISRVSNQEMPAVAVTDQANLFGLIKFYQAAIAKGVKPIIGSEIWLHNDRKPDAPFCLVLLCQNQTGYNNLKYLLSRAYIEGQALGKAIIQEAWLSGHTDGLIALSSATRGDIGQALLAGKIPRAEKCLAKWQALFPERFYLELVRTGRAREEQYVQAALDLAEKKQVPVVATNDVRFLSKEDYEAHEARVCIHDGYVLHDPRRPRLYSEEQYLRSPSEMIALFSDVPEAIENTLEIAKRCSLPIRLGESFLPNFPVPEGMTVETYLEEASQKGLEKRLAILFDVNADDFLEKRKPFDERLKIELDVINQMGFPGYFLIVADFIQWSKNNGIAVGPGRGSGAGSLVAYALDITDIEPLKYELLFERFLNPERVSMPDFDIDFCMEGRDRVIEYVAQKYGRESVSQIITFGTMAAKAVVRDVGRVLDHPYGFVDKIAKMIPFELGITLDGALEDPILKERYENDEEVRALIDLAKKLEGVTRNAGKHAGGVVISPGKLTDFCALYCEEDGHGFVTQFDKDDVESAGLVKFDFLGLRTLTIIDWAVKNIKARHPDQKDLDITLISVEDEKPFELLKACETTAVFQLESRGMKDLIKRLQPDCFEDIVALVALFRPGPLQSGMVDDFIDRKHGRAKVNYPHPSLEPILKPTYGVILYQEQVMQIAQVLAGYSLGAADILRRAMGKKKPEEMAKQREIFTEGSIKNGVDKKVATRIFDLMEKFAGYGFNKSHSAAYALIAYQTAWLKAYYPSEFMAAVLSSDMDNTDKVVIFVEECEAMKLKVLPPDVNKSEIAFTVNDQGEIVFGLAAIKGAGEAALASIIETRQKEGEFKHFFDFCKRVELRKVTKRVIEALIKSGAVDHLGPYRSSMFETMPKMLQAADQHCRNATSNQDDMFLAEVDDHEEMMMPDFSDSDRWPMIKRLQYEKETLGFYLSGHPYNQFANEVQQIAPTRVAELPQFMNKTVKIAGLVVGIRTLKTKRGKSMAIIGVDDSSGRIELVAFSEVYDDIREKLVKDIIVFVDGEVAHDDFTGGVRMTANNIVTLDDVRQRSAKCLQLIIDGEDAQATIDKMAEILTPFKGGRCPVQIRYSSDKAKGVLSLGKEWAVNLSEDLLSQLRYYLSDDNVIVKYK